MASFTKVNSPPNEPPLSLGNPCAETKKNRLLICLTGLIDHFDTALYSFLAPFLAPLFFPTTSATLSLILAYGVFLSGIVCRPFGVWLAHKGAQMGQTQKSMALALTLLSAAVFGMGLLPTYQTAGAAAPLLLVCVRSLIDVGAAWERALSRFSLINKSPDQKAVHLSSIYESLTITGLFLASLTSYGVAVGVSWRLFFILAGLLSGCLAVWRWLLLFYNAPTKRSAFRKTTIPPPEKLRTLAFKNKRVFLALFTLHSVSYATYAVPFLFFVAFVPLVTSISKAWLTGNGSLFFAIDLAALLSLPYVFRLCSPIRLARLSLGALAVGAPILFLIIPEGGPITITLSRLWIVVWGSLLTLALPLWERQIVGCEAHRYGLCGLAKTAATSIVGRNLTAILLACYHLSHMAIVPGVLLTLLCAGGLFALQVRPPKKPD